MDHVAHIAENTVGSSPAGSRGGFLYLRYRSLNALSLAIGDTVALALALLAAGALRLWLFGEPVFPAWSLLVLPVWWGGAFLMQLLPSWGLGPVEELRRITILLFIIFGATTVFLFFSQQGALTSRLTLTSGLLFSLVLVPLTRIRVRRVLTNMGRWGVPVAIYGAGKTGVEVLRLLQNERGMGYNPVGFFDDNAALWGLRREGLRVLGGTDLITPDAPVAILALPNVSRTRLVELLEGPLAYYRTVMLIPNLFEVPSLWVRPRDMSGMLGLEIASNLVSPLARFTKRFVDLLLIVLAMPLWVPVCLMLGLAIWLEDRESPFFRQRRIGVDGERFDTLKFRTMVKDAEAVLKRRLDEDPALRREWETTFKLRKDPRITRAGRLLRRFSLDELPQLINVLRGEMSLVGPRPLPAYHHEELTDRVRTLRERIRPGLTGLWQVSGRSDSGNEGLERWDAYYVRNWSLWLDIVILTRTVRAVLGGKGAY